MEPLLDLNKLHKRQARQRARNIAISGLLVMALVVGGIALFLNHKKPTTHLATVTGEFSASSSSTTPTATSQVPAKQITKPTSTLEQESTTDDALSAQEEANIQQETKNFQSLDTSSSQTTPTISEPTVNTSTDSTSSTYEPSTPTYTVTICPEIDTYTQNLTGAEDRLNHDENSSQSNAGTDSYGLTGTQEQSFWNGVIAQDQQAVNAAQLQVNNCEE